MFKWTVSERSNRYRAYSVRAIEPSRKWQKTGAAYHVQASLNVGIVVEVKVDERKKDQNKPTADLYGNLPNNGKSSVLTRNVHENAIIFNGFLSFSVARPGTQSVQKFVIIVPGVAAEWGFGEAAHSITVQWHKPRHRVPCARRRGPASDPSASHLFDGRVQENHRLHWRGHRKHSRLRHRLPYFRPVYAVFVRESHRGGRGGCHRTVQIGRPVRGQRSGRQLLVGDGEAQYRARFRVRLAWVRHCQWLGYAAERLRGVHSRTGGLFSWTGALSARQRALSKGNTLTASRKFVFLFLEQIHQKEADTVWLAFTQRDVFASVLTQLAFLQQRMHFSTRFYALIAVYCRRANKRIHILNKKFVDTTE